MTFSLAQDKKELSKNVSHKRQHWFWPFGGLLCPDIFCDKVHDHDCRIGPPLKFQHENPKVHLSQCHLKSDGHREFESQGTGDGQSLADTEKTEVEGGVSCATHGGRSLRVEDSDATVLMPPPDASRPRGRPNATLTTPEWSEASL